MSLPSRVFRAGVGFVVAAGALAATGGAPAASAVELRVGARVWAMDPATLRLDVRTGANHLLISGPQRDLGAVEDVQRSPTGLTWRLPRLDATVSFAVDGDVATFRAALDKPGAITWPVIAPDDHVAALLLPHGEGVRIPPGDEGWAEILNYDNTMTEEFTLPCFGLDLGPQTVSYLVVDPFDVTVLYRRIAGRLGFTVTRRFTRLDPARVWEVHVAFGPGTPLEPALWYRSWLQQQGKFVSLADKIAATPKAARLVGAIHAYLWGLCLNLEDVTNWRAMIRDLGTLEDAPPESAKGRVWAACPESARKAVRNLLKEKDPYEYVEQEVTRAFAELLNHGTLTPAQLQDAFPGRFRDSTAWGDAISPAFLDELHAAGVANACLVLNDLSSGDSRPQVAEAAERLGYLYGPYDCYDAVHPPGMRDSWETAQFDRALYDHGGVKKEDGSYIKGFQGAGRQLCSLAARPYLERRVREKSAKVPFSAWFVDCDASGQFFDDFSAEHPVTAANDCAERLDRLAWITKTLGVPIGSETGSALAASAICFAHGMLTGAIGWQEPEMTKDGSPYNLGGYWPPEAPEVFFKAARLMRKFGREDYDPRYRIPLYEAALHDSVVATHHWSTPSLKFKGEPVITSALLEQLYNVPPLYHFTRSEFARLKSGLLAHAAFFVPLHRRLARQALTAFDALTPDRLVQRTRFADGTEIVANFRDEAWAGGGFRIPARSVVARTDGETSTYTPAYPLDRVVRD